jgi:ubiquinone/menaquinone biosynthesis C-methylase UbiE
MRPLVALVIDPDLAALARIIIAMDYDQSGIATTYDEARALTPARRRRWQRLLSAHVDGTAISLVVDLGCGTGRFSEMLAAELGAGVVGLDPSEKMIDQARRKTGNEPCRIWAGVSTRAFAPGQLR